jgi:uncharacterized protein YciI
MAAHVQMTEFSPPDNSCWSVIVKIKPMKKLILSLSVLGILLATPLAAQKVEPQHNLVQFQMALLKKGPRWTTISVEDRSRVMHAHDGHMVAMLNSGKAVFAGLMISGDVVSIFILRTTSSDEAKNWIDANPAVKAGVLIPEIHPWWSEDIFRKANSPLKWGAEMVYLGFLKKGPNRKEGDDNTPEIQELQKAHIANIARLARLGKIVAAGPFGDDGEMRGVLFFRVPSQREARELCASDPMVKIGRLAVELYACEAPEGLLP